MSGAVTVMGEGLLLSLWLPSADCEIGRPWPHPHDLWSFHRVISTAKSWSVGIISAGWYFFRKRFECFSSNKAVRECLSLPHTQMWPTCHRFQTLPNPSPNSMVDLEITVKKKLNWHWFFFSSSGSWSHPDPEFIFMSSSLAKPHWSGPIRDLRGRKQPEGISIERLQCSVRTLFTLAVLAYPLLWHFKLILFYYTIYFIQYLPYV